MAIKEVTCYRCSDGLSYSSIEKAQEHEKAYLQSLISKEFEVTNCNEIKSYFVDEYWLDDNTPYMFCENSASCYGIDSISVFKFRCYEDIYSVAEVLSDKTGNDIHCMWKDDEKIYVYDSELYFTDEDTPTSSKANDCYQVILPLSVALDTKIKIYEQQNIRYINEILNPSLERILNGK